jgi:hypothetical protein
LHPEQTFPGGALPRPEELSKVDIDRIGKAFLKTIAEVCDILRATIGATRDTGLGCMTYITYDGDIALPGLG